MRKAFIGSGIRYDLFLDKDGFLDEYSEKYLREVVTNHTSGWFKVAPEHMEDHVLRLMSKPPFALFSVLRREFSRIAAGERLPYRIVPYFISSHPGCTLQDMKALAKNKELRGIQLEQVQDFTPTPMTASSVMFYTGKDLSGRHLFVERSISGKKIHKYLFFRKSTLYLQPFFKREKIDMEHKVKSSSARPKKRAVISYDNMSPELQAAFKEKYPRGYADYMGDLFKVDKPDGSCFYAVEVDIPDAVYLVKIDVDIDDYKKAEEDLFDDDVDDAAEIGGEGFPDNGDEIQGGEDGQMDD